MTDFSSDLRHTFGSIDIYLFDQLHRGRFDGCHKVLDVGCGSGRNLVFLLRHGLEAFAVDQEAAAVERTRDLVRQLAPHLSETNICQATAEELPYSDASFDAVLCNAVLHFASDQDHFWRMVSELGRVLRPGGILFTRLASDIGLEDRVRPLGEGRYRLPDGSDRFLVNEAMLLQATDRIGGELLDPLKTTIVQNLRCMTTWCVRKK